MKRRISFLAVLAALTCTWLAVPSATAGVIDLGIYTKADLFAVTGSNGADVANELAFLNLGIIPTYNAANNPDIPTATLGDSTGNTSGGGGTSITLDVTGWTYLLLKWDGEFQYIYLHGESGLMTFNSTVFNTAGQPQGLSGYVFFGPTVPDGGATIFLLGAALIGLSAAYKKLQL